MNQYVPCSVADCESLAALRELIAALDECSDPATPDDIAAMLRYNAADTVARSVIARNTRAPG